MSQTTVTDRQAPGTVNAGDAEYNTPRGGERLAVSVDEAAGLLGISRDLAYDLVAQGQIPAVRLGRRIVIPRVQLELLLSGQDEGDSSGSAPSLPAPEPSERPNVSMTSAAARSATSRKWA